VEAGYNRDHESLPQINLGVVYGEPSALPLCYRVYPGSIHDVSTLRNAVLELEVLSGERSLFVLDKGFYSQANIRHLSGMDFIIPLPVKTCVYRGLVASAKDMIRQAAYAIRHGKRVYYGMHKKVEIGGSELTAHIYLDEKRQTHERELFLRALLEGEALMASLGFTDKGRLETYMADQMPGLLPYFRIRKQGAKYAPVRSNEKIDAVLGGMGLFVLVTNTALTGEAILEYYRERDGVEKCFDSVKNNLFLKRLRVHSEHTLEGLLFIEFIALILRSYMTRVLKKTKSLKGLYIPELISELRKLKQITFGKKKVLTEISKSKKIFSLPLE
jgi:transposase